MQNLIPLVFTLLLIGCSNDDSPPTVEVISFSPLSGIPGDAVKIVGKNFGQSLSQNSVSVGNTSAEIVEVNNEELTFIVPENSSSGKIVVKAGGQTTQSTNDFIVLVDITSELDQFILDNSNIPSIALTVVREGEIIFSHGAGFFDISLSKIPDENTLYVTSSISKLIVSVAIMQQVEMGNLDLDQDVGDFLGFEVRNPNFPDKVITTRMLMKHNASLSNPAFGEVDEDLFSAYTAETVVELFPRIADAITPGSSTYNDAIWMNVEPGTFSKNSNFGMTLLGYLVEKLSEQHFNDYSKEKIFDPLGMNATSFYYPDLIEENIAVSYSPATNEPFEPFTLFWYPAGMMYTSGSDWSRFLTAIINGGMLDGNEILTNSSVSEMLNTSTPPNNNLAYGSNIGLIWREAAANQGWIGHTAGGFVTHITEINLENKIGYVLFTNESGLGNLIGPGSALNQTIHKWLDERINDL